jgi:ankyrin repeat protein
MQASPVQSPFSPSAIAESGAASHLATERDTVAASILEQQIEATKITWVNLPIEVLVCIMQKINDPISILMLSTTCQKFRAIYQDDRVYEAQERRHHLLMYNLTTPALSNKFCAQVTKKSSIAMLGNMVIPAPNTAEWQKLRDQPLETHLIDEASSKAWVKNLYITVWDLLLQPEVMTNQLLAAELMKLLLYVVPHISNAEAYVATVLGKDFPDALFAQLADIHLDRCIQVVAKHFPIDRNSPAYEFIVTQLPATLNCPSNLIEDIKAGKVDSILFYCVKSIETHFPNELGTRARTDLLDMLFSRGCDINQTDQAGQTILHHLSNSGLILDQTILTLLQTLLQHPSIDVNAKNAQDESVLDTAVKQGQLQVIEALLQHAHLNINTCKYQDISALYFAIQHNVLYLVQNLLITSKITLETLLSAFNYTVWKRQDEMVNLFLQTMSEQEQVSFISQAFTLAGEKRYLQKAGYRQGAYKLVKILFQHGTHDDVPHEAARTLFVWACEDNEEEVVSLLLQYSEGGSLSDGFTRAIKRRSLATIQVLLQYPQIKSAWLISDDLTEGLMLAINESDAALLQALLPYSFYIIEDNRLSSSLLTHAIFHHTSPNLAVVKTLLQCPQIDVNEKDRAGSTALHSAAIYKKEVAILQALLHHPKIDVNARDKQGENALDRAVYGRDVSIVQALLQHPQIDVNARDKQGRSALDRAVGRRNVAVAIIQALLQHPQIDVNARDKQGESALDKAVKRREVAIIQALLQHPQIDVDVRDEEGALRLAISRGNVAVAKALLILNRDMILPTCVEAFCLAIRRKEDKIISIILQTLHSEKERFINHIFTLALKQGVQDIANILRKEYGAVKDEA